MGGVTLLIAASLTIIISRIVKGVRSNKFIGRNKILAKTLIMSGLIVELVIIGEHIAGHYSKLP